MASHKATNTKQITLKRTYYERGTHGTIVFPNGYEIHCLERPWDDNKRGKSCIPEGEYSLGLRFSPVVKRSSGGEFDMGYEVENVPNRTYIMFHVGNYIKDSDGCILIGTSKDFIGDHEPVVWQSKKAFRQFMELMNREGIESIKIVEET